MRHCTAMPVMENDNALVWGTYFGVAQKVLNMAKKLPAYRRDDGYSNDYSFTPGWI